MNIVQTAAASSGRVHPIISDRIADGADKRSPQVVEHLPATHRRNRAAIAIYVGKWTTAENPRQKLPVAARPAVVARRSHVVAGRKLFNDLDIGSEARPGEHALEQIVAQQRRVRNPVRQRGLECINVVDAFAGVGSLSEQILVHVGYGRSIGIDTVHAREYALKPRAFPCDRQRRSDPRLQNSVAFDNTARGTIETRFVERMRHLADQSAHGVAGQPRIGVESDDVPNVLGNGGRRSVRAQESRVRRAAKQPV